MTPRPCGGFSLLEAMIALLVLSIGMLGIAALQAHGIAANRSARLRTHAVNLVADMAERLYANRLGAAAYTEADADRHCDPQTGDAVCAPGEMAVHDVFVWKGQVEQLLPGGAGRIVRDLAADPPTYSIAVTWIDAGEGTLTHRLAILAPEH